MKVSKQQTNRDKKAKIRKLIDILNFKDQDEEKRNRVDYIKDDYPSVFFAEEELKLNPNKENIKLLKDMCKICNIRVKI